MNVDTNTFEGAVIISKNNKDLTIIQANNAFYNMVGYSEEEIKVLFEGALIPLIIDDLGDIQTRLEEIKNKKGGLCHLGVNIKRKDGEIIYIRDTISYNKIQDAFYILMSELNSAQEVFRFIKKNIVTDEITDLYTTSGVIEFMKHYLEAYPATKCEIIKSSIKNLSRIALHLGQDKGNELIRFMATYFSGKYKKAITCRTINNEFIIFNYGESITQDFNKDKKRVEKYLKENMSELADWPLVSKYGYYSIPPGETNVEMILEKVNTAFEAVKYRDNDVVVYDQSMEEVALKRIRVLSNLNKALEENAFNIYFKPMIAIPSNQVIGATMEVYWDISPQTSYKYETFYEYIEDMEFIRKLDKYVIEEVCKAIKVWQSKGVQLVPVTIRFSKAHIRKMDFSYEILELLKKYQINPKYITIQLTKDMTEEEQFGLFIKEIKACGFRLAADNFGSCYLFYKSINDYKIDYVCLDYRGDNLAERPNLKRVIAGFINLAHTMKVELLAVGVEDEKKIHFLDAMGCDRIQSDTFFPKIEAALFAEKYLLSSEKVVTEEKIKIQCFPDFAVFVDDKEILFRSRKAKEILAYLVSNQGDFVNVGWIITEVLEDSKSNNTNRVFQSYLSRLRKTLEAYGISKILESGQGQYKVCKEYFECDYYDYLEGDESLFKGEFLRSYSWGEAIVARMY